MDAGQKLICKSFNSFDPDQSVLNCQKRESAYIPVSGDHIQLLHDGSCHWFLLFSLSGRVQVYYSLRTNLKLVSKKCLKSLYQPFVKNGKLDVSSKTTRRLQLWSFCSSFCQCFTWWQINNICPFRFIEMRNHLIKCLKGACLRSFVTFTVKKMYKFDKRLVKRFQAFFRNGCKPNT